MANVKISELPLTLSVSPTALIPVVQNGTTCSTYACLIAAGGASGTSGSSGATGTAGASGSSGTSGGLGAVIVAGSGTQSSVRAGVGNFANGEFSFAGGGVTNTVAGDQSFIGGGSNNFVPGTTSIVQDYLVTSNTECSAVITGNVTNFFPGILVPTTPPAIGSTLQGGTVFYILQSGDIGYDPAYIKGLVWAQLNTYVQWGTTGDVTGTSQDIGTGAANTALIIAASGSNSAAYVAANYTGGGYNDWYLGSRNEYLALRDARVLAGDPTGNFWTSSQFGYDSTYAYLEDINTYFPSEQPYPKYYERNALAFRTFQINAYVLQGVDTVEASFRGSAGTSGISLTEWTSSYAYPSTTIEGNENIGVGPYQSVQFTFTNSGAEKSAIVGGNSNVVNSSFSFIGGGGGTSYTYANSICENAPYSFIGGGAANVVKSAGCILSFNQSSFVYTGTTAGDYAGGISACATSGSGTGLNACVIFCNNIPVSVTPSMFGSDYKIGDTVTFDGANWMGSSSDDLVATVYEIDSITGSAIIGGIGNTSRHSNSFIAGCGIASSINNALHVNNLVFANAGTSGSIPSSDPGVCGQVFRCGNALVISGF